VVEGHGPVLSRAEFDTLAAALRRAGRLVEQGADEDAVLTAAQAETGQEPDEDLRSFVHAFIIGRDYEAD
jgi:hypothetical protein